MRRVLLLILSVIIIVSGGFLVFAQLKGTKDNSETTDSIQQEEKIPVVLEPLKTRTFERRIEVQGNVEARNFANVSPRVGGTIENIYVDEGDYVTSGITRLFQIDSVKLQQAVKIRRQEVAVAQYALREKKANLEQVIADLEKAETDLERYNKLYEQNTVSIDDLEKKQTHYKSMLAMKKHAVSLVELQREQLEQAEIALQMAEKDLRDATIYAPFAGVVTQKLKEAGEMGAVGVAVLRIEDMSLIEISAYLPAQHYADIIMGTTGARVHVNGIDIGTRTITYKSPTIHPKLRTFEIKCRLRNPPEGVVPGALAEFDVVLEQRTSLGIPQSAVQQRKGSDVIFTIHNNTARMLTVQTGLETDGYIEVSGDELHEGMDIVVMGQFLLDDGSPVVVRKEDV